MYIDGTATVTHYPSGLHGLAMPDLDAAAQAIVALGQMLCEDPQPVLALTDKMRDNVTRGTGFSHLSEYLHGDALIRRQLGATMPSHFVYAFWHNGPMAPRERPFFDLSLNLAPSKAPDGGESPGFTLVVTDKERHAGGPNHTESRLAAQLGCPRPISNVTVTIIFGRDGKLVTFDMAAIARALLAVDGLSHDSLRDPVALAERLARTGRDDLYKLWPTDPCRGMEVFWRLQGWDVVGDDPRSGWERVHARANGADLVAPRNTILRHPPQLELFIKRAEGAPSDQPLLDLAAELEASLYANIY